MVISALAGLVLGAIGLGSAQTNVPALIAAAACGGAFAACMHQRSRIQKGLSADAVPNLLSERFGKNAVCEFEGVHVVVTGSRVARPGEIAEVCLYLQNCHDAPGDLIVTLQLPEELAGSEKAIVPSEARARLAPLAVGVMRIPVLTTARLSPGIYPIELEFGVEGLVGRRVRRWRPQKTIVNKLKRAEFVAAVVVLGWWKAWLWEADASGMQFKLCVEGNPVPEEPALPPVTYTLLWAPDESIDQIGGDEVAEALTVGTVEQLAPPDEMPASPVPEPLPSRPATPSQPRICLECAAEVDSIEAERAGSCPNCGAFWH